MALLRSGKNVISTMAYHSPAAHGDDYAATFEAACQAGGATLMGAGMNPDCGGAWLAASLTRMCTDVKYIEIIEIDDLMLDPHLSFMVDVCGIGKRPEDFTPDMEAGQYLLWAVSEGVDLLARNLGAVPKLSEFEFELYTATRDFDIPVGKIQKGTVCGARLAMTALWN